MGEGEAMIWSPDVTMPDLVFVTFLVVFCGMGFGLGVIFTLRARR
jgi:hypothetical protein